MSIDKPNKERKHKIKDDIYERDTVVINSNLKNLEDYKKKN